MPNRLPPITARLAGVPILVNGALAYTPAQLRAKLLLRGVPEAHAALAYASCWRRATSPLGVHR